MLNAEEILLFLDLLREKYCNGQPGYSDDPKIGKLQAKLSIMLEVKSRARPAVDKLIHVHPDGDCGDE